MSSHETSSLAPDTNLISPDEIYFRLMKPRGRGPNADLADIEAYQKVEKSLVVDPNELSLLLAYAKKLSEEGKGPSEIRDALADKNPSLHSKGGHTHVLEANIIRAIRKRGTVLFACTKAQDGTELLLGTHATLHRVPLGKSILFPTLDEASLGKRPDHIIGEQNLEKTSITYRTSVLVDYHRLGIAAALKFVSSIVHGHFGAESRMYNIGTFRHPDYDICKIQNIVSYAHNQAIYQAPGCNRYVHTPITSIDGINIAKVTWVSFEVSTRDLIRNLGGTEGKESVLQRKGWDIAALREIAECCIQQIKKEINRGDHQI